MSCVRCFALQSNTRSLRYLDGVGYVCQDCESHYSPCNDCGYWFYSLCLGVDGAYRCESCQDSYESCDDDDYCTCGDCADAGHSRLVHNYSYKPRPMFNGDGPLFLGPEIEITVPRRKLDQAAETATQHLGSLGYLKEDSSIGMGFEIVTHPMTYPWAMTNFPWAMFPALRSLGCSATSDCGMHVHVSRAGFSTPCHQYRWQKFIYRNARRVQQVARRTGSHWATFDATARKDVKNTLKGGRGSWSQRYVAINATNDATLEMRIFASTLSQREAKAALGLAHATVEYTRTLPANKILQSHGWDWNAFTAWARKRPEYRPLTSEMRKLCVS